MSEKPLDYMARYKPIQFSGCGSQGQKSIRINRYISGDVMAGDTYRTKAYKDLKSFVFQSNAYADFKNGAEQHYYFKDTGYLHSGELRPIHFHYCPWDDVRQAFQGKGTPARFARVLKVCDYYVKHAKIDPGRVGWARRVTDLQEYVDYYIGMDCNGFVGAYLEENFPSLGVKNNIDIDSLGEYYSKESSGSRFVRIDDPKSIKRCDILVRRRVGDSSRHVALVESVLGAPSSTQVKLLIAESRGGDGLASRTETLVKIKETSNHRHWKLGSKEYDAVIRCR